MSKNKRSTFSGKLGFVLSAAGASVGLGNIWRFPYLAAKYGGGIFLLVYIILALTFGYTMIMAETSIGRMTKKSPVGAYQSFGKSKWLSLGGWINAIIPILIVPYYSVIGGWVIKYLIGYFSGQAQTLASDTYFSAFISNGASTEICFIIFTFCTLGIIYAGVQNGIERVSKFMMPVLVVLSVIIAIYSVTRPGALEGVKYFLVPNPANFSWMTVVAAMGQMFYSLSIAMGILVTFGSYMKKDVSIEESTKNVEIFDTAIAIMAGLMIIPVFIASLFMIVPGIVLSIAWTLSYYFLIEKGKNPIQAIKASNDATYGSKWTMFFVSLVVGVLFGIVFGIFQAICNAIGIGFITFVVMFILYVLAISISMSISASFWKQLKDNVE